MNQLKENGVQKEEKTFHEQDSQMNQLKTGYKTKKEEQRGTLNEQG